MIQGINCVFKIPLIFWGKVHLIVFLCHRAGFYFCGFSGPLNQAGYKIWLIDSQFLSTREAEKILNRILNLNQCIKCIFRKLSLSFSQYI